MIQDYIATGNQRCLVLALEHRRRTITQQPVDHGLLCDAMASGDPSIVGIVLSYAPLVTNKLFQRAVLCGKGRATLVVLSESEKCSAVTKMNRGAAQKLIDCTGDTPLQFTWVCAVRACPHRRAATNRCATTSLCYRHWHFCADALLDNTTLCDDVVKLVLGFV